MSNDPSQKRTPASEHTIQSRRTLFRSKDGRVFDGANTSRADLTPGMEGVEVTQTAPWILRQYINGEIDLGGELAGRFPDMPLLSTINFRTLGEKTRVGVATLATQDRAATMSVQLEPATRAAHFTFTLGSILSLRFQVAGLSDMDRTRWLELMRGGEGTLAFLWGQERWDSDYVICAMHRMYINFFAFSPRGGEAAARCTTEGARRLTEWLQTFWAAEPPQDAPSQKMTTW